MLALGLLPRQRRPGEQPSFARQPCVLELLHIGHVVELIEAEVRQELLRGDIGVGCRPAACRIAINCKTWALCAMQQRLT